MAVDVHEGDLLFVTAGRSGLSAAIDDATGKQGAPSFDHVALVAAAPKGWEVLHADEKGSRRQSLVEFRQDARAKQRQIVVYRLRAPQQARSRMRSPPRARCWASRTTRRMC
jgi:hypothetical protein